MEFKVKCASWIKEDDEKVLESLQQSDRMLTAEELSEITGVPLTRVQRTLSMLARQLRMGQAREQFLKDLQD